MKKFFLLFMMAVMTATVANAQTEIPSDEVLNRYRGDSTNVVIGAYVTASFCNDLVFSGTYNNYSATLSDVVRFVPVDSFPDWYVCSFYDDGTNDFGYGICGKIVALRTDGSFDWLCQWGDYSQILRGSAYMEYEYGNEVVLRGIDTSAPVVLSVPSWKGGADPCALKQTYTVYLDAPSCADAEGNTFQPAVCGDFTGWNELIPMNRMASGRSYMATFEAYPGQTFRFVAMGEYVDWDNQLQSYSFADDAWVDAPIITLDTMSQLSYDYSEGRYGYCVNVPTPEPEPVNYGLRTVAGVPVVADSMRTNIAARAEMFVIGFEGYESGDLWFGTPVVEYGSELCAVTAKLNLYTAATSSYLCLMEFQSFATGGRFGGHVTLYAQALDPASGRVLHSDSLVVPFYGLILGPEPEPEPEFVVPSYIQMPDYEYFYKVRDSITDFPICRLEGGTRNCSVEWGWVENYDPQYSASGAPMPNSDITKPTVYHALKEDTAYTVESDPTSTTYKPVLKLKSEFDVRRYYSVSLDETFYCRVYQNDSLLREGMFIYMNEMQVRSLWISMDGLYNGAYDGDSVPHRAAMEIDGPGQTGEAYIEWYNVLDTAEMYPADVFRNGNSYYAKVMTPFDSLFMPGYVLNERTSIYWGGAWNGDKSDNHYDNSGVLRSPAVSVDDVVWEVNIRLENGGYFIRSRVDIHRDSLVVDTVRLEMATDVLDWMPLMGEELYIDRNGISGFLPALAFRAGTYYFRFVAEAGGRDYVSQVYTIVIGGGINIDMENVTEGVVEYDAETNTVTISDAVIENVVTALTNMQDGVTISLEGITTVSASENGILTSADIVIAGSYSEGFVSTDTMTISAPRPIVASAEGVKITFDGVTLHLVLPGHEGDVVPGEVAARHQMSPMMRARYIAKTVLLTQDAEEGSVISGFDEADFINCGIIEPEGAEYDEDDLELMNDGVPVYNCTIVPMDIPTGLENVGLKEDKVGTDKRVANGMVLIVRQEKVYTMTGQLVK